MRTRRPYVRVDPDELERIRQIDLLTYLREFEPGNLQKVKGTTNVYCTVDHDSLKISNGKWFWWSQGFGGYSALDYLIKVRDYSYEWGSSLVDKDEFLNSIRLSSDVARDTFYRELPEVIISHSGRITKVLLIS